MEKGTPVERQGRKATGLRGYPMTAGLPSRIAGCDISCRRSNPLHCPDPRSQEFLDPPVIMLALLVFFSKRRGRNPIGASNVSQSQYPA